MRTNTLFAAAAIVAAGVISSQAQGNVYSLNVVGYVNVTLKPGYNLVANQLVNSSASINQVLTNTTLEDFSTFFGWDAASQSFTEAANYISPASGGPAWYNADYSDLASDVMARGKSYFIFNAGAADATVTFVGEVAQGSEVVEVPNNYSFLADVVPVSQEIKANGFPIADFDTIFTYDPVTQSYTEAINGISAESGGPDWYNADYSAVVNFAPAVGQGFVHFTSAGSVNWVRNFTVNP